MTIGLDIGERFTVVAHDDAEPSAERTNFVELPAEEMVLDMLSSGSVEYVEQGDSVYAVGDAATDFAGMFDAPVQSLLRGGVLTGERDADATLVELLIEQVAGDGAADERATYAIPAEPVDEDVATLYHRRTIDERLATLGYDPDPVTRGRAAGYAGFGTDAPSGLVLVLGTGTSEICLLDDGEPLAGFGLGRGGSWIDRQVADATDQEPGAVADEREGYDLTGGDGDVLGMYCENYLSYVVDRAAERLTTDLDGASVPVVIAGPAARPDGVDATLESLLADAAIPFDIDTVRVLDDPVTAVARGAVLAPDARTEQSVESAVAEAEAGAAGGPREPTADTGGSSTPAATADSGADASASTPAADAATTDDTATSGDLARTVERLDDSLDELRDRVGTRAGAAATADLRESVETLDARVDEIEDERIEALSAGIDAVTDDFEGIRSRLADLEERLDAVDGRLDDTADEELAAAVTSIDDALSGLRDDLDDVEQRLDDAATKIDRTAERTGELETRFDDVAADADTALARTDGIEARFDGVEEQVATAVDRADGLEERIEAVEGTAERTDSLEASIAEVDSAVAAVERSLADHAADVDETLETVDDRLETATDATTDLESRVDDIDGSVAAADERIGRVESSTAETDERVDTLEGTVGDLDDRIARVENQLDRIDELESALDRTDDRVDELAELRSDVTALESRVETLADADDGPSEAELREIAVDAATERVLAPTAGVVGLVALLAGGVVAALGTTLPGVAVALVGVACLAVYVLLG
jgi:predicted  nucleic acid-binding Zn-ribbon protein